MSYTISTYSSGVWKEYKDIEEKPCIITIDGSNGTPVAIGVTAGDELELCLPLGATVIVESTAHPAIMQEFLDEIKPKK